jgi:hypothetical protein
MTNLKRPTAGRELTSLEENIATTGRPAPGWLPGVTSELRRKPNSIKGCVNNFRL